MVATHARVVVVFRRYAGKSWMVGRLDLAARQFDVGAWCRGTLWPRRSDLSPDGTLLYTFVSKASGRAWPGMHKAGYQTFSTVSKVPWLFALAAWREAGTWGRGFHFVERPPRVDELVSDPVSGPDVGAFGPEQSRWGLARTEIAQYAVERRRGWIEHEDCPPRDPNDVWDEERSVILTKPHPGGRTRLVLSDRGLDLCAPGRIESRDPAYRIERGRERLELPDVAWADWDHQGPLVVATRTGRLQIRDATWPTFAVLWECDLNELRPAPAPAPKWAQTW
jgi:hypothetical protein